MISLTTIMAIISEETFLGYAIVSTPDIPLNFKSSVLYSLNTD